MLTVETGINILQVAAVTVVAFWLVRVFNADRSLLASVTIRTDDDLPYRDKFSGRCKAWRWRNGWFRPQGRCCALNILTVRSFKSILAKTTHVRLTGQRCPFAHTFIGAKANCRK
jgi:hypothetical protein